MDDTNKVSSTGSTSGSAQSSGADLSIKPDAPKVDSSAPAAAPAPLNIKASDAKAAPSPPAPALDIPAKTEPSSKVPESKVPAASGDPKAKLSFTNIFNKQKAKKKESKVMSSVLAKKGGIKKLKPILGNAPTIQKEIEQERESKLTKKLRLIQGVFVFIFLASVAMAFYFYSELSPTFDLFGQNTTSKLADVNANMRSIHTNISKYRYLAAQLDLNSFSYVSDEFLDKTSQAERGLSNSSLQALSSSIAQTSVELPPLLASIKDNLSPSIVLDTVRSDAEDELTKEEEQKQAEDDLRSELLNDRKSITQNSDLSVSNEQDLRIIDNTLKLVGNNKLLSTINAASVDGFSENLKLYIDEPTSEKRDGLVALMGNILASTRSDISIIGAIKSSRIEWSSVIKHIEEVTAEVDPKFGRGLFETLGDGIFYNGYNFESGTNRIVLSGITKTTGADNFEVMSTLIQGLEQSSYFQNVEMRSFSKSGTYETGFTANFKITLELETGGFSSVDKPISLVKRKVAGLSGKKRSQ